ncbi:MAG: efflux transporter outer membrane subunit [Sphingomonadales bacterium]|nr:efflux transporter outer membrane subunit [Sphingomonadales bacterium]
MIGYSRHLPALAAALALAACTTVGPNYRVPDQAVVRAPAAQAPFAEAAPGVATAAPLPDRWWHLYNDPVLDDLEQQALAANTDLRIAAANLERARAVTSAAEARHEPDIGVSVAAERARLSGESFLQAEPLPVATLGDAGVRVAYQVDLFGGIRRTVEAAHASEAAVAATRDAVRVTVAADVARAYLGACAAGEDLALAREALALQDHALQATLRLAQGGRGTVDAVTLATARRDQVLATLPGHAARQQAALYRLVYLTGHVPADYPRAAAGCDHIPVLAGPVPVGDGAALLRRRPDIRAAERRLAAATARIGVATAELYPSVTLGAGAGSSGFLKDLGQAAANFWSLGSLIAWNFPGQGARARVRAADADADAELARFDGTVLEALRETETALNGYARDLDRARAIAAARAQAETAADQARRLRLAGRSPLLADLGVQQGAIAARAAEAAARADVASGQVTLFLALGGGW